MNLASASTLPALPDFGDPATLSVSELKAALKTLGGSYANLKGLPKEQRKTFGDALNRLRASLSDELSAKSATASLPPVHPIDLSAPALPGEPLSAAYDSAAVGTKHPLISELYNIIDIYTRMGFNIETARQLDSEFHMFESLNFPAGHPARDGYDTFRTTEGFIPPAHTSTMQHRILRKYRSDLESIGHIAAIIPGRVFRNEDVDATHEHTFYQCEGIFVSKTASLAQLLSVLSHFFAAYYGEAVEYRTQPAYFPFTEPSLEFLIRRSASLGGGWLEMFGCGMIHPNVLRAADIDPDTYRGFAWGGGVDRLVMLRRGINDVRYFHSADLDFLNLGASK